MTARLVTVGAAVSALEARIAEARSFWLAESKGAIFAATGLSWYERGKLARQKFSTEIAGLREQADILSAPFSGVAEHEGRLFVSTTKGAFEYRDGQFVYVPLMVAT